MKRPLSLTVACTALLMLGAAGFAWQWPLQLDDADAGAYRVELPEQVYARAADAQMRDMWVLDADGRAVPAMLFAADAPDAAPPRLHPLPWFVLPPAQSTAGSDVQVISERSQDGRVLRVETRSDGEPAAAQAWLVDASNLDEPLLAIQVQVPDDAVIDAQWRVEGSDDLRDWRTLQASASLLQVQRDGQRVRQLRIPLPASARYLRLLPQSGSATVALTGVQGEAAGASVMMQRQWHALDAQHASADRRRFTFLAPGPAPFDRADIQLPGNAAGIWRLESRDADDAPWRLRAGPWALFQLGATERSPERALAAPIRDRQWRLSSDDPSAESPRLRLAYVPEVMVFVASGRPPYRLAAGSARDLRAHAPLDAMLAQIRERRGAGWQPATARIADAGQAGDANALQAPRDWKKLLLWGVLVLAALVVLALAVSLLRGRQVSGPV